MSESFRSYPVLTENCFASIGYVSGLPNCSYTEGNEEFPLVIEYSGGLTVGGKLTDERCSWYPSTHNLKLTKKCRLTTAYYLFGQGGVAASGSVLGLALMWSSKKTDERGVIPFGEIRSNDSSVEFSVNATFDKGKLKGSLRLETILYLKAVDNAGRNIKQYSSQVGSILGYLDSCELFIDGNGSVFPIVSVYNEGKPLWEVWFRPLIDPMEDSFSSENVEIRLNSAHPCYEALRIEGTMAESPLFLEVLSAAMMVIVASAKKELGADWDNAVNGHGYESGSIAEAIHYFYSVLQWDFNSPASLSSSIREFFEKNSSR